MTESVLTVERILVAAEDVLRRYGPSKATVVDVAQALGVSHGSVYRHFASKAALRDAVLRGWLERVSAPLQAIAANRKTTPEHRLRAWLSALRSVKREKLLGDPELFATYNALANDAREVVGEHISQLLAQIELILAAGVADKSFREVDVTSTALAIFNATSRFHNPAMSYKWAGAGEDAAFATLLDLLLHGLTTARNR
ncbi:TetR/AcrR family transcriptional regulator [Pseudolysobacter antarcticus]|uniref:TetR/AcrR family transcriptional regulator n=1 Tax=Pseudolysobacter antarcticus TaxID=2511995 RepID=A0A411HG85_9GAMM|nr:TetR family transcriptional regulator [Pseudolysobacter antarcticus]QBB69526.1 TetR/AcrR family transcriptional regulator [Pseudolysobacter antarcticus]